MASKIIQILMIVLIMLLLARITDIPTWVLVAAGLFLAVLAAWTGHWFTKGPMTDEEARKQVLRELKEQERNRKPR